MVSGSPIQQNNFDTTCEFTTNPVEKDVGQGFRSWAWTEPYRESLFQDGLWQVDQAYHTYTTWLNKTIPRDFHGLNPFDQRACLRHQANIFKNAGYDTYNWDIILNGTVGGLYQMNCIESLLWSKQNEYHPQRLSATEFGAFILLDTHNTTVKVYLQTGPTLGVPNMNWADNPIKKDLADGFHLLTFLHLHPFDASNTKYQDCAGTCIPSDPDLNAFASYLKEFEQDTAWITNGADSFRFSLSQLGLFKPDSESETNVGRPEIYRGGKTHLVSNDM